MDYLKKENTGTTIRMPSVANLMIDSDDRNNSPAGLTLNQVSPWEFTIYQNQNLQNGFFTRINCSELVLEWCNPNISPYLDNQNFSIDVSGTTQPGVGTFVGTIPMGFYTVESLIKELTKGLNAQAAAAGSPFTFTSAGADGFAAITAVGCVMRWTPGFNTALKDLLTLLPANVINPGAYTSDFLIGLCPDLRAYRYLDFISDELTYAQTVKDSSTQSANRNVLFRWYFDEDVPEQYDGYGFPIMMGYKPFNRRRLFNPPKQIRWVDNLPVGNVKFEVLTNLGTPPATVINPYTLQAESSFLMTLQLSEN